MPMSLALARLSGWSSSHCQATPPVAATRSTAGAPGRSGAAVAGPVVVVTGRLVDAAVVVDPPSPEEHRRPPEESPVVDVVDAPVEPPPPIPSRSLPSPNVGRTPVTVVPPRQPPGGCR